MNRRSRGHARADGHPQGLLATVIGGALAFVALAALAAALVLGGPEAPAEAPPVATPGTAR